MGGGQRKGREISHEGWFPSSDPRRNEHQPWAHPVWGGQDYLSLYFQGPKSGGKGHIKYHLPLPESTLPCRGVGGRTDSPVVCLGHSAL